ncbi:MAG: phenylalanine 4-monooxygenase [Ferruginibacter sp.]|uniref:GtrA family protein n=1 Tax=Ferruginibacter sp. TaxID=1940288 RepID=UPI00265AC2FE|nr:GtrA family protein [Ferruginibacter sp.]MDB5276647.1 phenylalanine 4-monooxygenase [Ferruginibacter sp.]
MRDVIFALIDVFYPPFSRIMPRQTFRYAACGGGNMVLGFLVFTGVFHFIAKQQEVNFGFIAFKSYSFSLFCSSTVVFIIGFLLNKYVVFTSSNLKGHIQLFRYFLASISSLCINYVVLNGLVLYLHLYPVLAQVIATAIVVTISFFMQQYFTFKVKGEIPPQIDNN